MGRREIWVDNVKVLACVLVALGHFFQSMVKTGLLPGNDLYQWFDQAIYYFHVPLFFICSGYLYQKYSKVDSAKAWGQSVCKKAVSLGVPYVAFSTVTWLLKKFFSGSVNVQLGGLFETLVLMPTSPYWFLYVLFFLFLVTPTFGNKTGAVVGYCIALLCKVLNILWIGTSVYIIDKVFSNEIWFVLGMVMSMAMPGRQVGKAGGLVSGSVLFAGFLILSILAYFQKISFFGMHFFLGLLACAAVIVFFAAAFQDGVQNCCFGFLADYTMPIFLMHTLFAAPLRTILLKIGVQNPVPHVALGLLISFGGPILAAEMMKRFGWLDFFLYPNKYIHNWKTRQIKNS